MGADFSQLVTPVSAPGDKEVAVKDPKPFTMRNALSRQLAWGIYTHVHTKARGRPRGFEASRDETRERSDSHV